MTVLIILWITFEFSVTVSLFRIKTSYAEPRCVFPFNLSHAVTFIQDRRLEILKDCFTHYPGLSWEALKNWGMLSIFSHVASEKDFFSFVSSWQNIKIFYIMVNIFQSKYCKRQGVEGANLSNSELAQCHFYHNSLCRNFPVSMEGTYNHYP